MADNYTCQECGYSRDTDKEGQVCGGCPGCGLGTRGRPHKVMPPEPENIPFGEFCICTSCGYVQRSTFIFDYYGGVGQLLHCETCEMKRQWGGGPDTRSAAEAVNTRFYGD